MLREPRNDLFHLLNSLESIGKIYVYTGEIKDAQDFLEKSDQMIFNATLTLLTNIGESIGKLSKYSINQIDHSLLAGVRGLRNRIVHDYSGLDSFMIFEIVKNDLDPLKNKLQNITKSLIKQKLIDIEEFEIARKSEFYKHVDFNNLT